MKHVENISKVFDSIEIYEGYSKIDKLLIKNFTEHLNNYFKYNIIPEIGDIFELTTIKFKILKVIFHHSKIVVHIEIE